MIHPSEPKASAENSPGRGGTSKGSGQIKGIFCSAAPRHRSISSDQEIHMASRTTISLIDFTNRVTRVARSEHPLRVVRRHHAPGTDYCSRGNPHAWQNDRPAAHSHVRPDLHRLTELPSPAQVHGRVNFYLRTKERKAADAHQADVQNHAVEVEEHPLPSAMFEP